MGAAWNGCSSDSVALLGVCGCGSGEGSVTLLAQFEFGYGRWCGLGVETVLARVHVRGRMLVQVWVQQKKAVRKYRPRS